MKQELYKWWLDNKRPAICQAEYLYREQHKPCGNFSRVDFRYLIKEFKQETPPLKKGLLKVVQINDVHVPYQDNKTLKSVYSFLEDFKPDQLVIAGDFLDFYELSTFDKNPDRQNHIQDELDESYKILKQFKELCPEIHFIKGNHEDRLRRFLWKNPQLASLKVLELSKLLCLDLLEIEYHEDEYILNEFRFHHGTVVRGESGASAKAEHIKYGSSSSAGHTHRLGTYYKTDARGTTASFENGCLCDLRPEYVKGIPNWQQALSVFYFDDNRYFCQQVPIVNHKFIYNEKLYG